MALVFEGKIDATVEPECRPVVRRIKRAFSAVPMGRQARRSNAALNQGRSNIFCPVVCEFIVKYFIAGPVGVPINRDVEGVAALGENRDFVEIRRHVITQLGTVEAEVDFFASE